jgi:general stress protein 26
VTIDLNFEAVLAEKARFFDAHHTVVLATSQAEVVSARTVSYATVGLDFYILSWDHHEKVLQIRRNPNVALARDNVSIKGVAEILGPPLDAQSRVGAEAIRKKRPREFEAFSRIPGMVMIKVTPTYVKSWVRLDGRFFVEHVNLAKKEAYLQKPEK